MVLCACLKYEIDPERANYVKDGIPMCPPWTCQKVKEHRELHYEDAMPNEIHARE